VQENIKGPLHLRKKLSFHTEQESIHSNIWVTTHRGYCFWLIAMLSEKKERKRCNYKGGGRQFSLLAVWRKVKVPLCHTLHGSIASCCKSLKKIKSGRSLAVGVHHTLRIGWLWFQIRTISIDVVTPVTQQLHSIHILKVCWPWLCKLSSYSPKILGFIKLLL